MNINFINGIVTVKYITFNEERTFSFRPSFANYDKVKEWIVELRSNKYAQGENLLKYEIDDGTFEYCCLGVAAEIHHLFEKENLSKLIRVNSYIDNNWFRANFFSFADTVNFQEFLAELNDAHYSFDEIAGLLETILPYFNNING